MKQNYKEKHGIINRIPYMVIFIRKKGDVIEEGHFVSNFLFLKLSGGHRILLLLFIISLQLVLIYYIHSLLCKIFHNGKLMKINNANTRLYSYFC